VKNKQFATWFAEQFGSRVSKHDSNSDDDLVQIIQAGAAAERELRRRDLWDQQREAALYAWQASEGKPKEPRS